MLRNSPPSHRHDGTSPLPLGMDWSPPPKRWDGRNTVWPHNHQTGWSYCVMIPSWSIQTEPGASHESLNPIVFYRIHVGIQSPQGISTSHELLRRFSDFLKLHSALKKAFPRKDIPLAPPKHAFLRINSSRVLLEERRHALAEWMQKLLSDIDLSRSAQVASFLELETAARSAFHYVNNHPTESSSSTDAAAISPSTLARPSSSVLVSNNSTLTSMVPYASLDGLHDNANKTSDFGIARKGKIQASQTNAEDVSLVHNHSANIAIGNGIMGESFFDQPEDFGRVKLNDRKEFLAPHREIIGGNSRGRMESISDQDHDKHSGHARKLSAESFESDISSIRGSELSFAGVTNSIWDGSFDAPSSTEVLNAADGPGTQFLENSQIVLPYDQRYKLNRVLVTMQRRLVTTKTDMEDLIARLNQEMAVKEYLTTKVKDLEIELEATEQKAKENLQQAILIERERVTEMQWDMDELRRKYSEMETKLLFEENERSYAESEKKIAKEEKDCLQQELDSKQEELVNMQKSLEELELKSKADIKVLVKEVKFLRKSQAELKEILNQSVREKTELEGVLRKEMQRWSHAKSANKTFLHECRVLRDRLQECSVNFLTDEEDKFTIDDSSLSDAVDLLATSDNRIGLLLAEAQLLARNDEMAYINDDVQSTEVSESPIIPNGDTSMTADDDEIRKTLTDVFIDNLKLRKQVNTVIRHALNTVTKQEKEDGSEVPSRKTVLNRFLER
ncbi:PX domain-containing protein EREL1-like isoform X1 [Zingiber officinale]|uniref:PX domain-containing protein EREL1-like isoform X1 n=2 Tax=Zingiber officinale TaxID=94328 RepID=UPI001C4AB2CA|nr:PX domain-containing protein EREL1-like isoform X1 [Zingiber officinale]